MLQELEGTRREKKKEREKKKKSARAASEARGAVGVVPTSQKSFIHSF